MPTISGRVFRNFNQRMAERGGFGLLAVACDRGDHRRRGQPRLIGISYWCGSFHARLPCIERGFSASCHSFASTRMKWFFSRCFQERHALAHQRIGDDHAGATAAVRLGGVECLDDRLEIVAVDALCEPAEGVELVSQRLERHHLR